MDIYKDMSFRSDIKSKWIFSLNEKALNYILILVKITIDEYELYPFKQERWMDFNVIQPMTPMLGRKIMVNINANGDILVNKIN